MLVTIQRWGFIVETGLAVLDGDNACLKEETHNCHASSFLCEMVNTSLIQHN